MVLAALVLPIVEALHREFKDVQFKDAFLDFLKETPLTYRIVVQFILILMKVMSKGAVLDDYFDDRAYPQTEPGNTDFIHGLCNAERENMKWLWDALDFSEKIMIESGEFTDYYKGSPLLKSLDQDLLRKFHSASSWDKAC